MCAILQIYEKNNMTVKAPLRIIMRSDTTD